MMLIAKSTDNKTPIIEFTVDISKSPVKDRANSQLLIITDAIRDPTQIKLGRKPLDGSSANQTQKQPAPGHTSSNQPQGSPSDESPPRLDLVEGAKGLDDTVPWHLFVGLDDFGRVKAGDYVHVNSLLSFKDDNDQYLPSEDLTAGNWLFQIVVHDKNSEYLLAYVKVMLEIPLPAATPTPTPAQQGTVSNTFLLCLKPA